MARYVLREKAPEHFHAALEGHPELVRELLFARGVAAEGVSDFLKPSFENHAHDPFLLPDMEVAVARILTAIEKGEKIAIWSDYDCDGIPGGALLHDFFVLIGYTHFVNYIPHRHLEGYGLNVDGLSKLKDEGVSLVITVDSGIVDVAQVAHANAIGLEMIVTDHHLPGLELPAALAVVNPKRTDSRYPFDGLSGTGVAWKLTQALLLRNRFGVPLGQEKWLLDLVALATVADMMPLVGENRALVHFGLLVMRKGRRKGIASLVSLARARLDTLSEDDIGFTIAPRINAASRMGEPRLAFQLLTTKDVTEAREIAKQLAKMNDARKDVVASMLSEIYERVGDAPSDIIVLGNKEWRPAVLGLVANNVLEKYGRPVCLWGVEGGGVIKGSCRSDGTFNVVEMMRASGACLEFGGHVASGGFSTSEESVAALPEKFMEAYAYVRAAAAEEAEVLLDGELSLTDATLVLSHLSKLAPFGEANPKPLIRFPAVSIISVKRFGKTQNHTELLIEGPEGSRISAIAFFKTPESFACGPREGLRVDVVGHLERDGFSRRPRVRLVDVL